MINPLNVAKPMLSLFAVATLSFLVDLKAALAALVGEPAALFVDGLVALITAIGVQPANLLADGFTVAIIALGPVVTHGFRAIVPLLLLAVVSLAFWAGWRRWRS